VSRTPSSVDVAVVGAGAAGLAAAKTVRQAGLQVALLEANGRVGGRAHTERATFGVPFDRGAWWLHSADINPLSEFARAWGFTCLRRRGSRRVFLGERWATPGELRERTAFYDRNFDAIHAAGRAGRDAPVSEVIEADGRWRPLLRHWIAVTSGVDPEEASTLDFANYRDTEVNWRVKEGVGTLVARYGADAPVELDAPVRRIGWGGRRVRLETPKGALEARAVIVTVSTGVLASGLIRFDPPLPEWKRSAIEAVPMGKANRIALQFDRDVFGLPANSSATPFASAPETLSFQLRPFGWNLAAGYVGGRLSSALERAGENAMIDFALEKLKGIFGAGIARRLVKASATAWEGDPYIRGGYTAALPGCAHRRADLAAPVDGRLLFAGEATSKEFYSTLHGAYLTGGAAAEEAARALRAARPPASGGKR